MPERWNRPEIVAYKKDPLVPQMNMLVSMAERIKNGNFCNLPSVWVARRDNFVVRKKRSKETREWETSIYEVDPTNPEQVAKLVDLATDWEKNKTSSTERNRIDGILQHRLKKMKL